MWYGKDTPELLELKEQYEQITGYRADGEIDVEYAQDSYDVYVRDLKICIEKKITLGDLYPDNEEEDW